MRTHQTRPANGCAEDERLRRVPIGAEVVEDGVHFRVWAPAARTLDVALEGGPRGGTGRWVSLQREENGYLSGSAAGAGASTLYRFRLDERPDLYPDPASRFQPDGPHGSSQVVDAGTFPWTDDEWPGVRLAGQVVYELHIGTFTREGT
jgi:maltooligosyltrehalose trehalohydrolase